MKVLIITTLLVCFVASTTGQRREWRPRKCRIKYEDRRPCEKATQKGVPPDYCLAWGCCYDNDVPPTIPHCYQASTDKFVSDTLLTVLAADGVPSDVILALYADANPGAEWLLAFRDGGLNTGSLLQLIGGDFNINPLYLKILSGEDPIKILLGDMAKASGFAEGYLEYLIDGNTEVILKHLLYLMSAQNKNPTIPYELVSDLISGKGLNTSKLLENYIVQLLPKGDKFTTEFYKALYSGRTEDAIKWAYLSAYRYKFPQSGLYPENTGLFLSLVNTQRDFPGKISPGILLALAKGEILPGINPNGETFKQLFGVEAEDYVCAAHQPSLQTTCVPLTGRLYTTSAECKAAGCCLMEPTSPGQSAVCFDNMLGKIGTFLAQNVIDEKYINETILGGNLPDLVDFIPWLPNSALPDRFTNWLSGSQEDFPNQYPTAMSIKSSKYRPNYKWRPHGPTAIPFAQRLPFEFLVPTVEPGIIQPYESPEEASEDAPLITQLTLNGFASACRAVQKKDRIACFGNSKALANNGETECIASDCCYDPDWSDLDTPACFRLINYGQCYKVPYDERVECGSPGINGTECVKNQQCCYDTALPAEQIWAGTPWCYYKKRSPILPSQTCTRVSEKKPCLLSELFNHLISEETCKYLGCCYSVSKPSWFDLAVGLETNEPACFQQAEYDLTPTEEPDEDTTEYEERCLDQDELPPHQREDCGHTNSFDCAIAGCCWNRVWGFPGAWCYTKSTVPV